MPIRWSGCRHAPFVRGSLRLSDQLLRSSVAQQFSLQQAMRSSRASCSTRRQVSYLWYYVVGPMAGLFVVALVLLWLRHRSVLDLWLMLVLFAYIIEIALTAFPIPYRFSVGWYAGRVYGVLSGSLVLLILMKEVTMLYGELLRAVLAQRREREVRLLTGDAVAATVAHEIKQPLSAMTMDASASLRWLDRATPNIDEAKAALQQIVNNGHRVGAVIENIRTLFKTGCTNPDFARRQQSDPRSSGARARRPADASGSGSNRLQPIAPTDRGQPGSAAAGAREFDHERDRFNGH